MIVVSDTGPICYLTLIGHVAELATLYGRVLVPTAVVDDLTDPRSPAQVRAWIASPPDWLEVVHVTLAENNAPASDLGRGELEAIALAEQRGADLLLCDDQEARFEAERRGLRVVGTLRVLTEAHQRKLLDGPDALARLRATNFRASAELLDEVLSTMRRS